MSERRPQCAAQKRIGGTVGIERTRRNLVERALEFVSVEHGLLQMLAERSRNEIAEPVLGSSALSLGPARASGTCGYGRRLLVEEGGDPIDNGVQ